MERIILYDKTIPYLMTKDILLKSDTHFDDSMSIRYFDTYLSDGLLL